MHVLESDATTDRQTGYPETGPSLDLWVAALTSDNGERRLVLHTDNDALRPPASVQLNGTVVIFDGALHNYDTLLTEAPADGPDDDDARLVLRLYLRHGRDALDRLRGTFVVIIWDGSRRELLAGRDCLGTYPLLYAETPNALLIATSFEALLRQPGVPRDINRDVIAEHVARSVQTVWEETWFTSIRRVPPYSVLIADRSGVRFHANASPVEQAFQQGWARPDEYERFGERLTAAVGRSLEPGNAGIFLSGGLDSISVAAIASEICKKHTSQPLWALSLAFPHPDANEETIQRSVAASLELPQVLLPFKEAVGAKGLIRTGMEISRELTVPINNPWYPAYRSLQMAGRKRGVRTILTGSGGDEWLTVAVQLAADLWKELDFAGLYFLYTSTLRSYNHHPLRVLRGIGWTHGVRPLLRDRYLAAIEGFEPVKRAHANRRRESFAADIPAWALPDQRLRHAAVERAMTMWRSQINGSRSHYLRLADQSMRHPILAIEEEELFEADRNMGIVRRMPYWDFDLIELLMRTPPKVLNRGGRSKGLVRPWLAERFPMLKLDQQKKVIGSSFFLETLYTESAEVWQLLGGAPTLAELGIVDPRALDAAIQTARAAGPTPALGFLWNVVRLESWLQRRH